MTQTRRSFLKGAMVTAAAPLILPSTAWGANAPSNRVNLAVIGAGGRGNELTGYICTLKDVRIVAVCDCFRDRRERMTKMLNDRYGSEVTKAYADFRDVLARDDVDGVVVATPDHWHVHIAIAAARAGKDMYVEKPLGVSMEWAWKLRQELKGKDIVFQYGTQQRCQPVFRQACDLVRNGYIGDIERVEVWCDDITVDYSDYAGKPAAPEGSLEPIDVPEGFDYIQWIGPASVSPYTADRCTAMGSWHVYDNALGFVAGWGAHPLDIAQWGLDADHTSPVRYEGTGTLPEKGLFNTALGWDLDCTYANGVKMRFMATEQARPVVTAYREWSGHGTTFFGSDGWVSVDREDLHVSDPKLKTLAFKSSDKLVKAPKSQPVDFVHCIKTRETPISPFEAALRSDTISHLCDIALRLEQPIDWDQKKEKIVGNDLAQAMLGRPIRAPWQIENL